MAVEMYEVKVVCSRIEYWSTPVRGTVQNRRTHHRMVALLMVVTLDV